VAPITVCTSKAFGQNPAPQIFLEYVFDIVWDRVFLIIAYFAPREEILFDDLEKRCLFRSSWAIDRLRFFWTAECGHALLLGMKIMNTRMTRCRVFVNKSFV